MEYDSERSSKVRELVFAKRHFARTLLDDDLFFHITKETLAMPDFESGDYSTLSCEPMYVRDRSSASSRCVIMRLGMLVNSSIGNEEREGQTKITKADRYVVIGRAPSSPYVRFDRFYEVGNYAADFAASIGSSSEESNFLSMEVLAMFANAWRSRVLGIEARFGEMMEIDPISGLYRIRSA